MGHPINLIYRRLGIKNSIKVRQKLNLPLPKESLSSLDLYRWNRSRPRRFFSKKQNGTDINRDLIIYKVINSWISITEVRLHRIHIKDNNAFLNINLFVYIPFSKELENELPSSRNTLSFEAKKIKYFNFPKAFLSEVYHLPTNILEKTLNQLLEQQGIIIPTNVITIYNISKFIPNSIKVIQKEYQNNIDPDNYTELLHILTIMVSIPVGSLLGEWLVKVIEEKKRPITIINLIKTIINDWDPYLRTIRGFSLTLKGRLGGADKALKYTLNWGQIPRETLIANIIRSMTEAHTSQGSIGIKIRCYYK